MPGIDSYTKLCIVSDGITDGNTTFNDLSNSDHTITAGGDVNHSTSDPWIGFTAIEFDGTSDYLVVAASDDWEFGTGDFTIECWFKVSTFQGTFFRIQYYHNAETNQWTEIYLEPWSGGLVRYYVHSYNNGTQVGSKYITSTTSIDDGEYHHIEIDRISGSYKLFIDGVSEGAVTSSGTVYSLADNGYDSHDFYIGSRDAWTTQSLFGLLDQFRVSKGIARHTSNFTPSDESFDDLIVGLCECTPPLVSLTATGTFPTFGFCEFNTPAPWLSSVGNNPILGYVEFNAPLPRFTAAEMSLGYVEIDTPVVSLSATGSFPIFGWAEFNTKRVSLDATGTSQTFGFGRFNTPKVVLFSESGGDVRMYSVPVSLDSTGVMAYPGFGEFNTPRVSLTSYGTQSLYATVNMTPLLPKLISRSTGSSGYEVVKYRR